MALGIIQDQSALQQGNELVVSDAVWGTPTGNNVTITSAGTNLPIIDNNEFFEVRDHSDTVNNGLYQATALGTTGSVTADKVSGSNPIAAASESVSVFSALDNAETVAFANQSGRTVDMTGTGLPSLEVGERFEIEDHSDADNNGTYEVTIVNTDTSDYTCLKLDTSTNEPNNGAAEALTMVTRRKNVMLDTAALEIYCLEQGAMDGDGVNTRALYSFIMVEWVDDVFLRANAKFPMNTIDADAGKYIIGQDNLGNNSGWRFRDNATFNIRTRKLQRNAGWNEIDAAGVLLQTYAGIFTLGVFEDPANDFASYQFGTDTTIDDTVTFTFPGPVNEAILVFDATVTRAQTTPNGYDFNNTGDTIDRNDGGSFITDGYKVGGRVRVENASTSADNGTYVCTAVAAGILTVENIDGSAVTFSDTTDDNTATLALDNTAAFKSTLRVRDGDAKGKTFGQTNLAAAQETALSNRLFKFGLANAPDQKIDATDADIDGNAPYTGMTLTFHATPQSRSGLVGGSFDFGMIGNANGGTNKEYFEWLQRQLRKNTDIDNDADTAIGVTVDALARFVGEVLELGSADGGLTFPVNPSGGGPGFFLDNHSSVSDNFIVFYDSLNQPRTKPETIAVTLDGNDIAFGDSVTVYTLFFDRTIRNTVSDLVINAGTGANGTFTSAGSNLPASLDAGVGAYVRIVGLTGGDEPMNGVYQVTSIATGTYNVTRYDGATIVTTTSASLSLDEHPIDTPDAIIVEDAGSTPVTGNFTADVVFSFAFDTNVQGGRTVSTDTFVQAKAVGREGAQYTESTVQTIQSGTPLIIPLSAGVERNVTL